MRSRHQGSRCNKTTIADVLLDKGEATASTAKEQGLVELYGWASGSEENTVLLVPFFYPALMSACPLAIRWNLLSSIRSIFIQCFTSSSC